MEEGNQIANELPLSEMLKHPNSAKPGGTLIVCELLLEELHEHRNR